MMAMTTSEPTAEDWENAIHCSNCEIQEQELRAWCEEHAGEAMADIVSECPPCQDWYPEVDTDGDLTGEIIHAQDEDYTMFRGDDRSQCLVRK